MRPDDADRRIRSWLDDGPDRAPDDLIESVLADMPVTRRRPRWAIADLPASGRQAALLGVAIVVLLGLAVGWAWLVRPVSPGSSTNQLAPLERLATAADFGNEAISDVIPAGPGLVAVGTISIGGHDSVAFWSSPDGQSWTRAPADSVFLDSTAGRLAQRGNKLVLGAFSCVPGGTYCNTSKLFVSIAGSPWHQATGVNTDWSYEAVVAGGPGFVAAGTAQDALGNPTGIVAISVDGLNWSEVPPTLGMAGATIGGLAAGPTGLVAVGHLGGRPAVWTSPDGLTWSGGASANAPADGTITDVAQAGSHWVAVGNSAGQATAWTSNDGTSWRLNPPGSGLDGTTIRRILAIGSGFVALGEASPGDGAAWQSADGTSWTHLDTGAIFNNGGISAVGAVDGRLVLFGVSASGQTFVAVSNPR
jgi:hypothetical protein